MLVSDDGLTAIERGWCDGLKPDPLLTVSEWADQYRILSQRASSEPGRWRTGRTPYLKEIMDCLSPSSPIQRVAVMKGAQVGGPLALDTPLPTPAGWTTMGDVRVGDSLFDENGRPCRVTGVSEVMTGHPCYRLAFDDREQIVADASLRWPIWDFTTDLPVRKVLRTDEMLRRVKIGKTKRYRFAIRLSRKRERMHSIKDGQPGRSQRRRIVDIYPVASVPVRCIEVDSPSHLYLCGKGWIPTHNTEAGNCWIGYVVHQAPGPMLAVSPTVELAKRNSKQRIDPPIEESDVLRERVKERRSRDSGNTVLSKEFPGGVLILTGANSAVGLRSMPARYLFLDEVDGYPGDVEGEGDPILLAERRSATFQRRKNFLVSTPKTRSLSRIEREFEASDKRYFLVPCPHCQEHQALQFENLTWPEGKPDEAAYVCSHCGSLIGERYKSWMLDRGEWRATSDGDGRTAGFHLSSLYSPVGWFSWADAAAMYEQAQRVPDLMKGFVNTVLGLPFEEEAEAPEWQRLYERRQSYKIGVVPMPGLFVTAGVDVQKDWLEVEVVAWGRDKESWSVDYRVLEGDTARPEVWHRLDELLRKDWKHESGHRLSIRVMCVDSGYATQDVYAWVRQYPQASWGPAGAAARQPRTVVAIRGRDRDTAILLSVSKADAGGKRRGLRVWSLGTPVAKGELYRWLKLDWPTEEALDDGAAYPPGACHFPQYAEEYFKQLTAERLVTRLVKGFPRASWEKEPGRRNEALDCRVYARAAASIYGLDRFEERHWQRMEEALAVMAEEGQEASAVSQTMPRPPARRVIQSGYMLR